MKTLNQFITENNGKYVEVVDPYSPNQCFDLVVKWVMEIDIPKNIFPFRYAYQIYQNFGAEQAKYFDRIYNAPDAIPKEGDIMVWNWYYNYAGGHTAIFTKGDVWNFYAFSQNDPSGAYCYVRNYNYNNIMGWLRPKNYSPVLTCDQKLQTIKDTVNKQMSDTEFRNWVRKFLGV